MGDHYSYTSSAADEENEESGPLASCAWGLLTHSLPSSSPFLQPGDLAAPPPSPPSKADHKALLCHCSLAGRVGVASYIGSTSLSTSKLLGSKARLLLPAPRPPEKANNCYIATTQQANLPYICFLANEANIAKK